MANAKRTPCKSCPGGVCLVGPYEEIKEECSKKGGQAHHSPPDWTMRQGTRKKAEKAKGGSDRIFGARADGKGKKRMPSINKGPAICLEGNPSDEQDTQHKVVHEYDSDIESHSTPNIPEHTIPLEDVLNYSLASIEEVAPECVGEVKELLEKTYNDYDKKTLVRKKKWPFQPKKPNGPRFPKETMKAWTSGQTS